MRRKKGRRDKPRATLYEVVYDAMPPPWLSRASNEARDALTELRDLVRDDPRAAVAELRAWIEREPLPIFFNWLGAAYGVLGEKKAVRDVVRENYRRNPDYLFARANYAEMCLNDGDLAGALEALGKELDIRPLLGGRRRIHVSEVTAYFYAVGLYHLKNGNRDAAESVYEMLEGVAPGEPGTEGLRRRLHPRLRDLFSR
jgi:tetratricopeptide (TPR) repeat protein